ncbi:cupin domain-containing protein [Bacillus shivajii]|uniref:cupin domain-containing protein n=1 Tax=Bacillus shivajii TaxID=1983719 RepID=UPI001CF96529|nr:cupin domain-containing protein [Bacillus shivajii]UCZ55092.1 cupin domain-containing protein [Bacillus shivajii]
MELFRFDKEVGKKVTHFQSNFVMSRIVKTEKDVQIGCMHLEANGIIGYHHAVVPQLLLVVAGEGWVQSDDSPKIRVKTGDAIYWKQGEGHETSTNSGLTAIVIESEELNPSDFMPLKDL